MSDWISSSIANVAIGSSGIVTGILLTRALGPAGRGALVASMIWPGLVVTAGAVLNLQTTTYYWRKATTHETRAQVLGVGLVLVVVLSAVLLLVSWAVTEVALAGADLDTRLAARMYLLVVPVSVLQLFGGGLLLASDYVGPFWNTRLIGAFLYLIALVAMKALGSLTVFGAVGASLVSQAIATAAMCVWIVRRVRPPYPSWSGVLCRQVVVFGAKTNFVGMPYALNVRLDQLLMSMWLSATVLGLYATAFAWSSMLGLVAGGASTLILSRSSATSRDDPAAIERLLVQFRRLTLVFVVLGAAAALAAPVGIPVLFGSAFSPSVVPAVILCGAGVLLNMNVVLHELARGLGEPGIGIRAELAGLVVTALALAALLRAAGGLGAAVASVLGYGTVLVVLLALLRRRLAFSVRALLVPRVDDIGFIVRQFQPLLRFRAPNPPH